MNNQKSRDTSIDILKGIGILFVILAHIQRYIPTNLLIYIYSFHMPLFFYISGYLYKEKYENMTIKEYTYKRMKELLYPYLTLSIINFIWYIIRDHSIENILRYIISFLYSNFIFEINYVGAIWFLMCLFVVEIMYFIFKKNKSTKFTNICILVSLFIGIIITTFVKMKYFRLPFWIDIALFALVFYHLGFIVKKYKNEKNIKLINKIIIVILLMVLNIISIILNYKYCNTEKFIGRIDMLYLNFGNYIYFFVSAISGIFTWQIISSIINRNIILELFGKNTLVIMGIHIIILQIITKIFNAFLNVINLNMNTYLEGGIIFIIVSICSLIVATFVKKFIPKLIIKK